MEPPVFTKKPTNKDIKEGASAKFEAAVKGKPLPEVTWFKGEEKIEPSERVTITCEEVKGKLVLSLSVNECVMEDAGDIRVTAVNPAGEDSCVAKLKIKSKYLLFLFISESDACRRDTVSCLIIVYFWLLSCICHILLYKMLYSDYLF